jgi:hypothetical protein
LKTQSLEHAQAEVQAKLQARRGLLQAFQTLAASAESELKQGQVPIERIAKLEDLELKIRDLDQALTGILEQAANKISGQSEPI